MTALNIPLLVRRENPSSLTVLIFKYPLHFSNFFLLNSLCCTGPQPNNRPLYLTMMSFSLCAFIYLSSLFSISTGCLCTRFASVYSPSFSIVRFAVPAHIHHITIITALVKDSVTVFRLTVASLCLPSSKSKS